MATTLITGASGFLGRHLLWQMLKEAAPGDRFGALMRAGSTAQAEARLVLVLDDPAAGLTAQQKARAHAIPGDLCADRLGGDPGLIGLLPKLTHILHCAASVDFTADLDTARRVNVGGTRNVLDLARTAARLERLDYIGTAYACGTRAGTILEPELDLDAGFNNSYERSKAEAEALVRAEAGMMPTAIYRPSIVVGDSNTGVTQSFNVLYWPLKVLSRRLVPCIPARRDGLVDIVPIDYVRAAICDIRRNQPAVGTVYHITSGPRNVVTVDQLVQVAARELGVWTPPYVSPDRAYRLLKPVLKLVLPARRARVLDVGEQFLPYLSHAAVFDDTNTRAALAGAGIEAPSVLEYFARLIAYGQQTDWGSRPVQDLAEGVGPM